MKILLVEDNQDKAGKIESLIAKEAFREEIELTRVSTVNDAIIKLGDCQFDLAIVDLVLPQMSGGEDVDATLQWCELIENHLSGRTASWIVMTAYADVAEAARQSFAYHNVAVVYYDESSRWEAMLSQKLRDNYVTRPLDFVIICALEKERSGFDNAACVMGELHIVAGLNCQKISIGELRGEIVAQPNPGMISAAIVATKALAIFRPRALAMSGICGGRDDETKLGALIVPDISWNYQSGKFVEGELKPDLQQVTIPPTVRSTLAQMATAEFSKTLRTGLIHSELGDAPIQLSPMVSGSQVVADEAVANMIGGQSRKVAGIDMEVASILFAAHDFFDGSGVYLAAKAVVDLANPHKDDRYHEYGCALSARFIVAALGRLLEQPAD